MSVRVAEARIKRTKAGAKIMKFSEDVAAARERIGGYVSGPSGKNDDALVEAAMADLKAQNEELLAADEELRVQSDELMRVQRRMEVERRRYREMFDAAPDAHFLTDRHGVIQEANAAASSLLGVESRFLRGKPLSTYLTADDSKAMHHALETLQRKSSIDLELSVQSRAGEAARVAFRAVRMSDPLFYIWSARRSRQANGASTSTDASAGRLRATATPIDDQPLEVLSDELHHLLQSISTCSKSLRREGISETERQQALRTIEQSAERQAELLRLIFVRSSSVT